MPLYVLIILVVIGVGSIVMALHMLGFSRAQPWNETQARAAWMRQYPELTPDALLLAKSGRAALVICQDRRGLVWQIGIDSTAQLLNGHAVQDITGGLRLNFDDFGMANVTVSLDDTEKSLWLQELPADDQ